MYETKTKDVYENFSKDKKSTKSRYYGNSNKLVIDKMKDETAGVGIKEFVELRPRCILFW